MRVDCKRLRYTLEFFRDVLGPGAKGVISEVVTVQDHLGGLNDADVATRLAVEFLERWCRKEGRERISIHGVLQYLLSKQDELHSQLNGFPEVWRHFARPQVRQRLALATSALRESGPG